MFSRLSSAMFLGLFFVSATQAQTVRFDTNVGTFDMQLNPTGNANLQGHVDNMVAYVEQGFYDLTVINRAAEGFVMQMGGFQMTSAELPTSFSAFSAVPRFDPVIVDADNNGSVDFDVSNLLNTRGTVSLALSSSANTGTSSFFVNLGTNTSLDAGNLRFVPFAKIADMATIDLILSLNQFNFPPEFVDQRDEFGRVTRVDVSGGLGGDDVPVLDNNRVVFVERAYMLSNEQMAMASLATGSSDAPPPAMNSLAVPEPPALVLVIGALMIYTVLSRPKFG